MCGANLLLANGLLDSPEAGIKEGTFDIVAGNPPFGGKGLRDLLRLLEDPRETASQPEQDFFAVSYSEAAAGPRLSQQDRSELDRLARVLSQYSCWRLGDESQLNDEPQEDPEDAPHELFTAASLFDRRRPTTSDYDRAVQFIAHWPADRPLDVSRLEVRDTIRRLAGTAIEVMFTERFVRLAAPGGLIAVIVPESIVASDRLGPFRTWLLGRMDLLASISLPQKVFTGVGANARTSIIFARRRSQNRPEGEDLADDLVEADRPIFLAAPCLDAAGFTTEGYLARVLADAPEEREVFWPNPR